MSEKRLSAKATAVGALGILALSGCRVALSADITWEQAREMLRKGQGLANNTIESLPPLSGRLVLDLEVNTLDPLRLAGVLVKLDDRGLFLEPRAPRPGEIALDLPALGGGARRSTPSSGRAARRAARACPRW